MRYLAYGGLWLFTSSLALAHGGGLDSSGCHHDRKRGGYHCHGGNSAPAPEPVYARPSTPSYLFSAPTLIVSDPSVEIVQKMLNRLGYDLGRADGVLGEKTKNAIRRFEATHGMDISGAISDDLIDSLIASLVAE
jgi:hypothetical protein